MNSDTTRNAANDLTNRFALDTQGFDAMRAQAAANPREAMKSAAKQFDAVFTQMMLKSMRDATPSDGPFDSHDTATFTSMMDQQLAQQMSSKGIGVADAMLKQLMRNSGVSADDANAGNNVALNALAKAYANPANNGALKMGRGYSANSALTPAVRGDGSSDKVDAFVDKLAAPAQAASAATARAIAALVPGT